MTKQTDSTKHTVYKSHKIKFNIFNVTKNSASNSITLLNIQQKKLT